jgi:lupus La protein
MWTLYSKTPEHWVPIKIVASFKRMRQLLTSSSSDPSSSSSTPLDATWVAEQLRKSEFLEVDESGENVRRRTEPQPPKDVFDRSVYAKGFGTDEKDGKLLTEIQTFFEKWGKVVAVRMRRDEEKKFKVRGASLMLLQPSETFTDVFRRPLF